MINANHIVEALLELTEGLPELKQELIAKYGEEIGNKLIASVPEKNGYAYLEWLASQYKKGQFDLDDSAKMLKAINDYVTLSRNTKARDALVKEGLYVVLPDGKTKASKLPDAENFMASVEKCMQALETDYRPWLEPIKEKVKAGMQIVKDIGDLDLVHITNYEASLYNTVWPGDPLDGRSNDGMRSHAGTFTDQRLPHAVWCIQNKANYSSYAANLYIVRKRKPDPDFPQYTGKYAYIAISFPPGSQELNDVKNQNPGMEVINEILPLFDGEQFKKIASTIKPKANDTRVKRRLQQSADEFLLLACKGLDKEGNPAASPSGKQRKLMPYDVAEKYWLAVKSVNNRNNYLKWLSTKWTEDAIAADEYGYAAFKDMTFGAETANTSGNAGYNLLVKELYQRYGVGGFSSKLLDDDDVFMNAAKEVILTQKSALGL